MHTLRWLLLLTLSVKIASAGGLTWTDRGASAIKRMSFDGSALVTVPISGMVTSPGTNLRGIALDLAGGRMFWRITAVTKSSGRISTARTPPFSLRCRRAAHSRQTCGSMPSPH